MAYRAARRMTINGRVYDIGDEVPLDAVPPRSITTLVNMRRIIEVPEPTTGSVQVKLDAPARRRRGRPKGSKNKRLPAMAVSVEG